jgi:IclR family transcriptional regulator, acetate operon repressor
VPTKRAIDHDNDAEAGQTHIQSASRAVRILLAVAAAEDGLRAKQIADELALSLPTAYHLLNTLTDEGVVFKDERRRYLIGHSAAVIAEAVKNSNTVPDSYLAALNSLAEETGETAYLNVWRQGEIVVHTTVEGSQAVRVTGLTSGYSENIHARAGGKLLLAFTEEPFRSSLVDGLVLRRLTDATITSKTAFLGELERIRSEGIAFDHQEFREGVECVSAPIRAGDKVVACFTVSTPVDRFPNQRARIIEGLMRAATSASR